MLRKTKKVNMNLQEAIKILKRHNEWRRGAVIEMEHPKELGIAIDTILDFFENPHEEMINFLIVNAFRLDDESFKALMKKLNQR